MATLSEALQEITAHAWQYRIIGKTLRRSSLLSPYQEVFNKLNELGGHADPDAMIAATAQDIFDHLSRIADEQYKPGFTKLDAIETYVRLWYDLVLGEVYQGSLQKLLADEKLLRSAYLFYLQAQIPRKSSEAAQGPNELEEA